MPDPAPSSATDAPVSIAIGDVHGRADLLEGLLARIEYEMEDQPYRLIMLGDYIDRGPDSRGVIDALLALRRKRRDTVFLKGNHEQALIDFLGAPDEGEPWLSWGGAETAESYGVAVREGAGPDAPERAPEAIAADLAEALPDRHFAFLMTLALSHREGDHLFVHAGLNPDRPLEDQRERDMLWIRERFHKRGKGKFGDLVIVHGHTPVAKAESKSWRVNVDTGAVWSGKLTAVILEDGKRRFVST